MKKRFISMFLMAVMLLSMMAPALAVGEELPQENPPEESSLVDNADLEDDVTSAETEKNDVMDDTISNSDEAQVEADTETPFLPTDDMVNGSPHDMQPVENVDDENTANLLSDELIYENLHYIVDNDTITIIDCDVGATNISIPAQIDGMNVTAIGNQAFYNCSSLTSVKIPNSVTIIGNEAFYGCSSLTSVTISNSVTSIGSLAFNSCNSLTSINVASENEYYASEDGVVFNKNKTELICFPGGKGGRYNIPNSVISIGEYAFKDCCRLTSVTIPNSVTSIDKKNFYNCSGLTSITVPNSVTSIGEGVFSDCNSLTSINVASENKHYISEDGVLFNNGDMWFTEPKTELICFPGGKSGIYDIPNSVISIGSYAFEGCSSLTSVTIPNSVTNIGYSAFEGCSRLMSVTIPNSVTDLGDNVFENCSSLTSVIIPSSVTSIESNAFCGCSSLTSVTIPNSVTVIKNDAFKNCNNLISIKISSNTLNIWTSAFQGCSSLTSVTIPDSVTNIGGYAFHGCSSLTSVTIPKGVTSIGRYTFYNCSSLTSVTIPNSVTSISTRAFQGCSNLTSVAIPNSINSIGYGAFMNCSSLTGIILPNSVTSLGNCAFSGCSDLKSVILPNSIISIGTGVFMDCDSLKSVILPNSVTSIGYDAFKNCSNLTSVMIPNSVTSINDNAFYRCKQITIYCKDNSYAKQYAVDNNIPFMLGNFEYGEDQKPELTTDVIQAATVSKDGKVVNILTTRQSFEKDSEEQALINVVVDWGDAPAGKVLLSQSGKEYLQTPNGNFGSIQPGKYFEAGDAIYVIAVDESGNILESKRIYLQVTEPVISGEWNPSWSPNSKQFKLFNQLTFTVDEDKPLLGEQTFNIDLGLINEDIEINRQDGTFKVVMGINFEKDDNGKFGAAEFKNFKEDIKKWKSNIERTGLASKIFYKYRINSHAKLKIQSGWEPEAAICGYIEGKYENGNYTVIEGGLIGSAELKYTYEGQAFIVVVPVYYSIGAGGSVELTAGIKNTVSGSEFKPVFTGNLEIAPFFEIGGGIGVVYLGQIGTRGKATLAINIALDQNYRKVDLTGQAYFEIKALCFKLYEREFAKGTWTIYETGRSRDTEAALASDDTEDIYAGIDFNAPVISEDRSYANNPTEWLGETSDMSLMAADYTNKELRVLQTNAYPDAKPQIFEADGAKVMIWLTDNTLRDAVNKSMLVYSVYNNADDTWSAPKAIMDNGMGDYYPVAKDGYVVWQKAGREFDASATLTQVAQSMELYIAHFNGVTFDTPERLTNNNSMDAQPHIAVDGNRMVVTWTRNTENNILGISGTNSIYQMTFDGSSWSNETRLADGLNIVACLDVGYMDGNPVVAYVLDGDNDLNTIADREIYLIRNGSTERFTNNSVIDSKPVFENINGVPALFWYSDFNVYYMTDLDNQVLSSISADGIEQLTDDYAILSNGNSTAILWTTVQDGVSEVHGALYDGSQWSHDVEITQTGEAARYPSGVIEENGKFLIAFNRIKNIADGDYYKDGQADLCLIQVTPTYDISISDVFIDDKIAPNTNLPVYLTVTNAGELPVSNISADVKDVDGTQNAHFDYNEVLQPGESRELEAYYTVGSTIKSGEIQITVGTTSGVEYNSDNNSASVSVGQSDMEITNIISVEDNDMREVTISVKNAGYSIARNVKVAIQDTNGNEIIEKVIESIAVQAQEDVIFKVDANTFKTENSFIVLTAIVASDTGDANLGNNEQGFTILKGSKSPNPSDDAYEYTIASITQKNNGVDVLITGDSTQNAILYVSSYTQEGRMLKVAAKELTATQIAAGSISVDLGLGGASYVSALLLEDNNSMIPLTAKKTQSLQ